MSDTKKKGVRHVYYGPHPCQRCDPDGRKGTIIVKAGNGAPDFLEYDFVWDSHYPNHRWEFHRCPNMKWSAARKLTPEEKGRIREYQRRYYVDVLKPRRAATRQRKDNDA